MRLALLVLVLPACTSLQSAGVANYSVRPFQIDGRTYCCEVEVKNGKEFAALDLDIQKTGDDYKIKLRERNVEAFKGQEIAAEAAKDAISEALKAVVGVVK